MAELDYALLCDYVRVDRGTAAVIAAGIDTVYLAEVPGGRQIGLLLRVTFTRNESGRPHRLEVIVQDEDGERLVQIEGVITPEWKEGLPPGWLTGALAGFNFGVPLPRYGVYSMEILIDDRSAKSLNLRAEPMPAAAPSGTPEGD
jgi:hypothetical protein